MIKENKIFYSILKILLDCMSSLLLFYFYILLHFFYFIHTQPTNRFQQGDYRWKFIFKISIENILISRNQYHSKVYLSKK